MTVKEVGTIGTVMTDTLEIEIAIEDVVATDGGVEVEEEDAIVMTVIPEDDVAVQAKEWTGSPGIRTGVREIVHQHHLDFVLDIKNGLDHP